MPPLVARIKVFDEGKRKANLWVPLILIWPLFFVFYLLTVPLLIFKRNILKLVHAVWPCLFALKGTEIIVEEKNTVVFIKIK